MTERATISAELARPSDGPEGPVARRGLRERGQSIVEVALILPIALVLMAGAIDMGRLFFARVAIENAAREGAVFAANNPRCDTAERSDCGDPNTVDWRVRNEATSLDGLVTSFTCDAPNGTPRGSVADCSDGDSFTVTVGDQFEFVTPLLTPIFGSTMMLEATATSRVMNTATDPDAPPVVWPTPTPSPTPAPCTVPDMVGDGASITRDQARDLWAAAGFDDRNFDTDPRNMKKDDLVVDQDLVAGGDAVCSDAVVTVTAA